jgi:transcriptional regulator with XRE-family HTH domain
VAKTDDPDRKTFTLKSVWGKLTQADGDGKVVIPADDTQALFTAGRSIEVRHDTVRQYRTRENGPSELIRSSRLQLYREAAKLSTADLSARAMLPVELVERIEDGTHEPSADQRDALAAVLPGIEPDDLFPPSGHDAPANVKVDQERSGSGKMEPKMAERDGEAIARHRAERLQPELDALAERMKIAALKSDIAALPPTNPTDGDRRAVTRAMATRAKSRAQRLVGGQ